MNHRIDLRMEMRPLFALFRRHWKLFLGIHVAANLISLLVLTPLYTTLLGWLVLASGDVALTDGDILTFILSPAGILIFVLAMAVLATFLVFEQAALFLAAVRAAAGRTVRLTRLGRDLLARSWPLFRLGFRLVLRAVLLAGPFLAVAGWIYQQNLTDYDINYYLAQRPPVLWWAGSGIALCLAAMAWLLFRVFAGWIMSLPLLLMNEAKVEEAIAQSRYLAGPARAPIATILAIWAVLSSVLFSGSGALLDLGAEVAIDLFGGSLQVLAYGLGSLLVFWSVLHLAVTFISACSLNLGMLALYRQRTGGSALAELPVSLTTGSDPRRVRRSAILLAALFLLLSASTGWVLMHADKRQAQARHTDIIAHRGASADAPENSLAAMELAIEQGADWVEIDVQETRAGEVVVIHDSDLMKVGRHPLKVADATLAKLEDIDIGSWFSAEFSDQRVPTLRQYLQQVGGRTRVVVELKYYGHEQRLEERVAAIIEQAGMQDQVMLMSLSLQGVRKMKSLRPTWRVGLVTAVGLGDVSRLDADFFAVNARFAKRPFIWRARQRGRAVLAWVVNDPALMSAMMGREVDGVITDKPAMARRVREQRRELELHELLLIHVASLLGSDRGGLQ